MTAVGPVGTVKKPSVVGEAFSSRGGNPRSLRISSSGARFHQAFVLFSLFLLRPRFSPKNLGQDRLETTISNSVDR